MKPTIKLIFSFYIFIVAIELIKNSSLQLASNLNIILTTLIQNNPLKAVSLGWLVTSVAQSSGAVSFITATFSGNNIIPITTAIFIVMGTGIGSIVTALIISLLSKGKKRRDFRHGFEIASVAVIYNIILVIILFLLEYFFKIFTNLTIYLSQSIKAMQLTIPIINIVNLITYPLIFVVNKIPLQLIILIIGLIILAFSLKFFSSSILELFGGEDKARRFINKYFRNKYKAFFIGLLLTSVLFSSSITIGLMVPLAVSRLINLKKAIPYIIGAKIGTSTDTIIASLITGNSITISIALIYLIFGVIGAIIFLPNVNILFKMGKYFSKKLIKVTRTKALIYFIVFLLIPLLIILI
ncbi:MAG: Na/Pi cotransporter family protein [Nanoarchaeota archaeon]|nr:Na/Pi cotransporter family protein [Nanoarchaeota archaeon]